MLTEDHAHFKLPDEELVVPYSYWRGASDISDFIQCSPKPILCGFDTETYARKKFKDDEDAGLIPKKSKIRTMQFYDGESCMIFDLMEDNGSYSLLDKDFARELYTWLRKWKLVAHNAIFDLSMVQNFARVYDMEEPINMHCSQNMFRLIKHAVFEDAIAYKDNLRDVANTTIGFKVGKEQQMSDWSKPELSAEQIYYCCQDAVVPYLLAQDMVPKLMNLKMMDYYNQQVRVQNAVAMMFNAGLHLNDKEHGKLAQEWENKREEAALKCVDMFNEGTIDEDAIQYILTNKVVKPEKYTEELRQYLFLFDEHVVPSQVVFHDQNWLLEVAEEQDLEDVEGKRTRRAYRRIAKNIEEHFLLISSSEQVSKWLEERLDSQALSGWPRTKKKKNLKCGAEELEEHGEGIPVVEPYLQYKRFQKYSSVYGFPLKRFFMQGEERPFICAQLTQCHTATGRASGREPNLQQQPRDPKFRKLFVSRGEDYKLVGADYGQIELRVMAYHAEDEVMMEAFDKGIDIHTMTASAAFGVTIDKVTSDQRQIAKNINFGLAYGAGAATLARQINTKRRRDGQELMPVEEAQMLRDTMLDTYTGVKRWQRRTTRKADKELSVRLKSGKVRRLQEDFTYTTSMNTLIQGDAASVMWDALERLYLRLYKNSIDAILVCAVHDEVLLDVHKDCVEEAAAIVKEEMIAAMLNLFPEATTTKLVEVKTGDNWAEIH